MKKLILFVITLIGLSITELLLCNYTIENPDKFNTNVELDLLYAFENQSSIEFIEGCFRILPDPNHRRKKSFNNGTPLLISLGHQHSDWQEKIVPWLISRGADVNAVDDHGDSVLMNAGLNASATTVKTLLNAGAKVAYASRKKVTALHYAAQGNCEVIPLLVKAGADINARDQDGNTPLMHAVTTRQKTCVQTLLKSGADTNITDNENATPLIVISERGSGLYASNTPETRFEILQLLLAHKADVNKTDKYGESALMRASWFGEEKSLALLLQAGADVSLKNNKGKTALDMAKHKNNARIVKLLTK